MLQVVVTLLIYIVILGLHEFGHYIAARMMHCNVENISFKWVPYPRVFVSIIDANLSGVQRIKYLLAGNAVTVMLFIIYNIAGGDYKAVTYLFVFQIIIETNPFYSDYSFIVFYLKNKSFFKSKSKYTYSSAFESKMKSPEELKDKYFLSDLWYVHFVLWGILIVILCKLFKIE